MQLPIKIVKPVELAKEDIINQYKFQLLQMVYSSLEGKQN